MAERVVFKMGFRGRVFSHEKGKGTSTKPPSSKACCFLCEQHTHLACPESLIVTLSGEAAPDVSRTQKTREGCGCFRGLFGGSRGKVRENPGKIAGKMFPKHKMLQILGFQAPGKANLPGTLGEHCREVFFEIDSSSLLEFFRRTYM